MPQPFCATLSDTLTALAASYPGAAAVFPPGEDRITATDLNEAADQVARAALAAGIVPGEVVGVLVGAEPHFLTTIFGLWRAGAAITVLPIPDGYANEERHAAALIRYQIEAGMSTRSELMTTLAREGSKTFSLPYEHPVQAFTYTLIQEKATLLFYQRFKAVVTEPVLRDLLGRLARDEARHFAFYAELLTAYLRRHGPAATVPDLRAVVDTFRMPLADTLDGYWRWSLRVAKHAGYDHTEAYAALTCLIREFTADPGNATARDLISFVDAIGGIAYANGEAAGPALRPHRGAAEAKMTGG